MHAFHTADELVVGLSQTEIDLILSLFPSGASVEASNYFDNYDLPCPIKVRVKQANGESKQVVLRRPRRGDIEREVAVEQLLSKIGLPVPRLLAGPIGGVVILSWLEGEDLQHFSMRSDAHTERASHLLIKALETLESITEAVGAQSSGNLLERRSLVMELDAIPKDGPWKSEPLFLKAVSSLSPVIEKLDTPVSFTNGDHQPANFLTDGERVTGFLDFEKACFRDPLMGITKYPVYDLHPLNKAGFVDRYLDSKGFDQIDFAPRLALMCLATLQGDIPVQPLSEGERRYQQHVLQLLDESIASTISRAWK